MVFLAAAAMTSPAAFRRRVLAWYRRNGRDLPWRRTRNSYAILVSEIMLQQTQVSRVIPKYREFLRRFPTLRALSRAPLRDVLRCWSGLGYNRRARDLWRCAGAIEKEHGGRMPRDVVSLRRLPGIGRYTAGAVASFAFGAREAAVDTNVRRVLSRALLGVDRGSDSRVWELAAKTLPKDAASWNHALMDIGALYCRAKPACSICPVRAACSYHAGAPSDPRAFARESSPELRSGTTNNRSAATNNRSGTTFKGSRRQQRGRVIRLLVGVPSMSLMRLGPQVKEGFGKSDLPWLHELLSDLERDGLVTLNRTKTRAALA
jgi:A/G-specific adenine glycosylase